MAKNHDIETILKSFPATNRDSLIPLLQKVQDEFGYLSGDSISKIGKYLNLPAIKVYGLATFYNQFRFTPPGKYHLQVCDGTGCHMEGSGLILKELVKTIGLNDGETSRDGLFSLEVVSCIGACGYGPVIAVNGKFHSCADKKSLKELIVQIREESKNA